MGGNKKMRFFNKNKPIQQLQPIEISHLAEIVIILRSIDSRLKTLESTVRQKTPHRGSIPHIVTGRWID
jgi:hypothetical protein